MPAPANYFNPTRNTVKNQKTGYRNQALLAPVSWFTILAEPAPGSVDALGKTVALDHTFPADKGFIEVYTLPNKTEADGESTGDPGAQHINWKPKFFIPGDTPELQQMIEEEFLNGDLVLLLKDASCPDGGVRMYGCDCTPLFITKATFKSGTTGSGTKGWEVETETSCRYFYTGIIANMP